MLSLAAMAIATKPLVFADPPAKLITDPTTVQKTYSDANSFFDWTNLFGFDINVTWNNALITFRTVSYTTTLNSIWGVGWMKMINQTGVNSGTGYYKLVAVSTSLDFDLDPGAQALFVLTFQVKDPQSNHNRQTSLHFATTKLSDRDSNPITNVPVDGTYQVTAQKPAISLNPTSKTCRKLNEQFTTTLDLNSAYNVDGFGFEIRFNTTMLNYDSVAGGDLGNGTFTVNEGTGIITGNVGPSTPITGTHTLLAITWNASYNHIWKNEITITTWKNIQTGTILFQKANLTYPSPDPDLFYERGVTNEITIGSDVVYTWSPIKGDVDLNGNVEIYDLTSVAGYYDVALGHPLWTLAQKYELTYSGETIIDLYDLIIVASNFGFTYP
jgi:hypothetical protein